MKKKASPECEMCGIQIANPTTIKVEGALLRVCSNCTSFGNVVEERRPSRTSSSTGGSARSTGKRSGSAKSRPSRSRQEEDQEILIDNYGAEVKRARMKKKMTQGQLSQKSGVSTAYIRSIESENMRPTDKVAKKLEQVLGIELFEKPEADLEHRQSSDKKGLTVGDIVTIKHFEYDKS